MSEVRISSHQKRQAFFGSTGRCKGYPLILRRLWPKLQFYEINSETLHAARYISWAA